MTIFVLELKEVIASRLENRSGLGLVIVQSVSSDGGVFEFAVLVEAQCDGLLALSLVCFALGFVGGKIHRDGRPGLVIAEAQTQGAIANPLPVDGQRPGKGSEVRLQPPAEATGEGLRIDLNE